MTDTIATAIIGGCFTVFVALITIYHRDIVSIFRFRNRSVRGVWRGEVLERSLASQKGTPETKYDVAMELEQVGARVKGKANGKTSSGEYYEQRLKGRMEDEHFITLSAHSASIQVFDIAVVLLELDPMGKTLHGYGLANDLTQHGTVLGELSLTKVSS